MNLQKVLDFIMMHAATMAVMRSAKSQVLSVRSLQ